MTILMLTLESNRKVFAKEGSETDWALFLMLAKGDFVHIFSFCRLDELLLTDLDFFQSIGCSGINCMSGLLCFFLKNVDVNMIDEFSNPVFTLHLGFV